MGRAKQLLVLAALVATTGCAAVIEGTDQTITVTTDPTGAACSLVRAGTTIGDVPRTPGSINIEKTKDDIEIACNLDGFLETSCLNSSDYAGVGAANVLLGLLTMGVGFAVDSATGADNKYEPNVAMRMIPDTEEPHSKTLLCTETLDEIFLEDVEAERAEREKRREDR